MYHLRSALAITGLLLSATVVLMACAGGGGNPVGSPDSGVEGQAMVDGGCPILRPDSPCPDQPVAARITVTKDIDRSIVTTVEAGSDGHYRIPLSPGSYTLHATNPEKALLPRGTDQHLNVRPGRFEHLTLMFDSGVRGAQSGG